jgi:molybdopterin/thiamine biosynthesis adenylyltransferase
MIQLTAEEKEKYRRQMMILGFGEEAQTKLRNSTALVSRVGGLGGPAAMYLAMAGIGRLVIAHGGILTASNLNRQMLMRGDSIGKPRAPQAKETLLRANPDCDVIALDYDINEANAQAIVAGVDIVLDCPPTFEERFALNGACVKLRKPMIEAAMYSMEGTLTTIIPGETPCIACLTPEAPNWWQPLGFPVLGGVSASLGCLAAVEAVKVLTGFGTTLKGKLLTFDAGAMEFLKFTIRRRPDCAVCGGI